MMTVDICSDNEKLRIGNIQEMLSKLFWSPGITENEIFKGINNSALIVGAYTENGKQIGFLRVVSDKVRFAYLLDVVVNEDYRRKGIGRRMVKFALTHPELKDVYQWLLMTRNAHGVYSKLGFDSLKNPEMWMSIMKQRPDRDKFTD